MVASKILGWVDRRSADRDVGRYRRRHEILRVAEPQTTMTRSAADWLYRYRWWPWLVTLLVLPLQLWPAAYWFDVRAVHIASATVGEPLPMLVDRDVKRPFRGQWHATIRQWDGVGWVTWCNAEGKSNYRPEAKLPRNLALQWWTDGHCHPLPVGRYKVTTTWTIIDVPLMPDRSTSIDSNLFEVRP